MSEPFRLTAHPSAAKAFNEKADVILHSLERVSLSGQQRVAFQPNVHIKARLTERDFISPILVGLVDYRGREVAKYFQHSGITIAVQGEGFKQLALLAERVQKSDRNRDLVSIQCLIECGFQWLKRRHVGETKEAFTDFVFREAGALVEEVEIWFPLHRVYLESEVKVGKATFKTVTKEMLDQVIGQLLRDLPVDQRAAAEAPFNRTRSRLQACAAATIRLLAEPIRAEEIASEETEYSIAAFRFFHPANLTPYARSYCTKSGRENATTMCSLIVKDGIIKRLNESAGSKTGLMWSVPSSEMEVFRQAGLDRLSRLLASDKRSLFEKDVLDAFLIYSRNSLFEDPANRLIYILTAVESILLRDRSEPIQANLADRLAFLIGATIETRIAVRDRLKKAYELRSRFLHHGRGFAEMDDLETFMRDIWNAFAVLIQNLDKFGTKEELIDFLERRKMA